MGRYWKLNISGEYFSISTEESEGAMKTTQVTQEMTLLDLVPGDFHAVLLGKETAFNGGTRLFTQKVAVTDVAVFQRLCAEVCIGDKIQVTVATVWRKDQYTSRLANFCPLSTAISLP